MTRSLSQPPTAKNAKGFPEAKHRTELPAAASPTATHSTHPLLKMFLSQQSKRVLERGKERRESIYVFFADVGDVAATQSVKEREEAEIHQKNLEVLASMSKVRE